MFIDAECDAVSCQGSYSNQPPVCLTHMHNDRDRSHDDAGLMHSAMTGTSDVCLLCHLPVKHINTSCTKNRKQDKEG